jgi:hypothetical protein
METDFDREAAPLRQVQQLLSTAHPLDDCEGEEPLYFD